MITYTDEQEAIFEAILGQGWPRLAVKAGAGAGKSSTLEALVRRLHERGGASSLIVAFNRDIAQAMNTRLSDLRGAKGQTVNSLGYEWLRAAKPGREWQIDPSKYRKLAAGLLQEDFPQGLDHRANTLDLYDQSRYLSQLADKARQQLVVSRETVQAGQWASLSEREAVRLVGEALDFEATYEDGPWLLKALPQVLHLGYLQYLYHEKPVIDYEDQLFYPWLLKLTPAQAYTLTAYDEAQDNSPVKGYLIKQLIAASRHFVMVGDPRQAINRFAGADLEAMHQLATEIEARYLPLNVSFRCPQVVVKLAQAWMPEYKAAPQAIEGRITYLSDVQAMLQSWLDERGQLKLPPTGALVLSRTNAQQAEIVGGAIAEGIPYRILGRKTGLELVEKLDGLVNWATRLDPAKKASGALVKSRSKDPLDVNWVPNDRFQYQAIGRYIEDYRRWQLERLQAQFADKNTVRELEDMLDALVAFYKGYAGRDYVGLRAYIINLFTDTTGNYILGSTIHRAKGGEAEVVYLLTANCPSLKALSREDWITEWNIWFVGVTRAIKELWLVGEALPTPPCPYDDYMARADVHPQDIDRKEKKQR